MAALRHIVGLFHKFEAILVSQSAVEPAPLRAVPQASKETRERREATGAPAVHVPAPAPRYVGRLR